MIKTKNGNIRIRGEKAVVLADMMLIVHEIYFDILLTQMSEDEAKKLIMESVEDALLTHEQFRAKAFADKMKKLRKLLNIEESEDEAE